MGPYLIGPTMIPEVGFELDGFTLHIIASYSIEYTSLLGCGGSALSEMFKKELSAEVLYLAAGALNIYI